jgi:hypothetical protein
LGAKPNELSSQINIPDIKQYWHYRLLSHNQLVIGVTMEGTGHSSLIDNWLSPASRTLKVPMDNQQT